MQQRIELTKAYYLIDDIHALHEKLRVFETHEYLPCFVLNYFLTNRECLDFLCKGTTKK